MRLWWFMCLFLLAVDSQRLFRRPFSWSRGPGAKAARDIPIRVKHQSLGRAVLNGAGGASAAVVADYATGRLMEHIVLPTEDHDYDLYPDYNEDYRPDDWIE